MTLLTLKMTFDKMKEFLNIAKKVDFIANTEVAIGVFDGGGGSGKNANLLYLHCNGCPARNIPPRNVLKAGLEEKETKKQMNQLIRKGMMKALLSGPEAAQPYYEKAGMIGVAAVKEQFGKIPPPNAPSTVRKKGFNSPLIETGSLMNSISYEVRRK